MLVWQLSNELITAKRVEGSANFSACGWMMFFYTINETKQKKDFKKTASLVDGLEFKQAKPSIQVHFETEDTKEIRITLAKGQTMKEHKTKYPIVVEIFEGEIEFTVYGKVHH